MLALLWLGPTAHDAYFFFFPRSWMNVIPPTNWSMLPFYAAPSPLWHWSRKEITFPFFLFPPPERLKLVRFVFFVFCGTGSPPFFQCPIAFQTAFYKAIFFLPSFFSLSPPFSVEKNLESFCPASSHSLREPGPSSLPTGSNRLLQLRPSLDAPGLWPFSCFFPT